MAGHAVVAVAIANDEISARLLLQHEGKILRPHRRHKLVHRLRAHHFHHHPLGKLGFGRVIDRRRIVALERELAAHAERRCGVGGDVAHAGLDQVERLGGKGARRALNFGEFGNHIGRLARMNHRHRNDRRVQRGAVAGDDGLKRLHHLAGGGHRVDAQMRHGRMRPLACEPDVKLIARRHHRPGLHREVPRRNARPVVHAKHRLHRKALEQAVLDHLARAAAALFGRLEDAHHRAVEIARAGQELRCRQQHGGVAVVAAGVHLAGVLAGVGEGVELGHRQGVEVGAQADHAAIPPRVAAVDHPHHPGLAQAAMHLHAPGRQPRRHHVRRALLLKAQFGMRVQITPQRGERGGFGHDGVDELHGSVL